MHPEATPLMVTVRSSQLLIWIPRNLSELEATVNLKQDAAVGTAV